MGQQGNTKEVDAADRYIIEHKGLYIKPLYLREMEANRIALQEHYEAEMLRIQNMSPEMLKIEIELDHGRRR